MDFNFAHLTELLHFLDGHLLDFLAKRSAMYNKESVAQMFPEFQKFGFILKKDVFQMIAIKRSS